MLLASDDIERGELWAMAGRILVVDDERHIVRLIEINLQRVGYGVRTAYSAAEALEMVKCERPDLITLDTSLEPKNGWEVLDDLRADPKAAGIPVIVVGGGTNHDDYMAMELEPEAYLPKPFNPKALVEKVGEVLRSRGAGDVATTTLGWKPRL